MIYLVMMNKISDFKSLLSSMTAGFEMLIGYHINLTSVDITSFDILLLSSYFAANIFIISFLLNILEIAYKEEIEKPSQILAHRDEINLVEAVKKKFQHKKEKIEPLIEKNVMDQFSEIVDKLTNYVIVVKSFFFYFQLI
jgi:hypothetical protein